MHDLARASSENGCNRHGNIAACRPAEKKQHNPILSAHAPRGRLRARGDEPSPAIHCDTLAGTTPTGIHVSLLGCPAKGFFLLYLYKWLTCCFCPTIHLLRRYPSGLHKCREAPVQLCVRDVSVEISGPKQHVHISRVVVFGYIDAGEQPLFEQFLADRIR